MIPPIEAYFRVWAGVGQSPADHKAFHAAVWPETTPETKVVRVIAERVGRSAAPEADRAAVLRHLAADWQTARVMATMASSVAQWLAPGDFSARLTALREQAGLKPDELAKLAGLTRAAVYKLEAGDSRPTWATVVALATAMGVPTDAFRGGPGQT